MVEEVQKADPCELWCGGEGEESSAARRTPGSICHSATPSIAIKAMHRMVAVGVPQPMYRARNDRASGVLVCVKVCDLLASSRR